ncbi:MAG: hypothetical protein CL847_02435 [Crocinitomicaceae bacterium]|nr:hypothetical protein [Crocinitomicaceae bacterium]
MLTKNERNLIKSLRVKENRHRENRMVVEGVKGVLELLNSSIITERIYVTSGMECSRIKSVAKEKLVDLCEVSKRDMEIMSSLKKAPGILAVGKIKYSTKDELIEAICKPQKNTIPTILMLDDLVDPGNVGTLVRTALWFGLCGVVCSPRTADIWNAKTIQSSMGSVFNIPIVVSEIGDFIVDNNILGVGLDAGGSDLHSTDTMPGAIIVGSESHGISESVSASINEVWSIPGSGLAESLNASIAGAIACSVVAKRWYSLNR